MLYKPLSNFALGNGSFWELMLCHQSSLTSGYTITLYSWFLVQLGNLSAGPCAVWQSLCSAAEHTALFTFLRVLSPTPWALASVQLLMLQLDPLSSLPQQKGRLLPLVSVSFQGSCSFHALKPESRRKRRWLVSEVDPAHEGNLQKGNWWSAKRLFSYKTRYMHKLPADAVWIFFFQAGFAIFGVECF